jgi:cyclase
MLKQRLIFTLLYDGGNFMLSRNFRLQNVGNLEWLKENYDFSRISYSIDELVVLDVTRQGRNIDTFSLALRSLTEGCFVPITAGGGISDIDSARKLLRSGADKLIINSALYDSKTFISELASEFGQQCTVASVDIKLSQNGVYEIWSQNGTQPENVLAREWLAKLESMKVGEIYLNSIDRDGTGQGFDLALLDLLPKNFKKPIILAGGAGNAQHLLSGLRDSRVDAVATANLFNFVGNGLRVARESIVASGIVLPMWNINLLEQNL